MEKVLIFAVASLFGFMLRRQSKTVRGLIGGMAIVECLIVSLLPADANHWQTPRRRAVLFYEWASSQRRDWLIQTIAQPTCKIELTRFLKSV